jgi:hypothetical protein
VHIRDADETSEIGDQHTRRLDDLGVSTVLGIVESAG